MCCKSIKQGRKPACLNRELLLELGQKKKIYYLWKEGLASWEEDRAAVHIYREETRKAKAQLDLMLAIVVSDNKKGFFKYVNRKRRSRKTWTDN